MIAVLAGSAAAAVPAVAGMLAWRELGRQMEGVARACHELRGPITAARLGLELGARTGEFSPGRLRAIDAELERAALALEDLGHTRRRRGAVPAPSRVDLRALLDDSVQASAPAALRAGKELRGRWEGVDLQIRGDRTRLAQALGNLIANAIEHGGERIVVSAGVAPRAPAACTIEVTDDGPGLPAPVADLADRARRGRGARGRGLAIARDIAEAHGGHLTAAPTGQGARLVLELPGAVPATEAPVSRGTPAS